MELQEAPAKAETENKEKIAEEPKQEVKKEGEKQHLLRPKEKANFTCYWLLFELSFSV